MPIELSPQQIAINSFPGATTEQIRLLAQIVEFKQANKKVDSLVNDSRLASFDKEQIQRFASTRY